MRPSVSHYTKLSPVRCWSCGRGAEFLSIPAVMGCYGDFARP